MQKTSFERRQKEDDKKSEWKVEDIAHVAGGICVRVPWFLASLAKIPRGVATSLQCRRILSGRNLVRVRNIVVAAIFDFMTVEDWGE